MKILVSACLLGENCKYSGGNNYNQAVCDFARGKLVGLQPEMGADLRHCGCVRGVLLYRVVLPDHPPGL